MSSAPALFDTVLDRIRSFADARKWPPARLAREAGLSDATTRGMKRGDWRPSGSTVRALEALIPVSWSPGDAVPEAAAPAADADQAATATASEGQVG